eukprot:4372756-Prorocentrum_lima.AAC.1
MRENKVESHAGQWEGPSNQFWARFHPPQSLFQAGSRDHHSISKWLKCGMPTMERPPMGKGILEHQ